MNDRHAPYEAPDPRDTARSDDRYTDPGDYRTQDDEDREKRIAVIGPTMPIALELLERERERLIRDHFDDRPKAQCDGCQRLLAVNVELREIKGMIG